MVDKNIGTLSTVKVNKCDDLYKVVTILNKTLKERDLMFGLALDEEEKEKMIFTIYET
ncbi:YpmA family protein [Salipaludibacillus daqingensis]|uniref:YpmA family protein n=1 Tax=Salipaludibacillus daqingensis TaxID=3041001 RepID=UPI002476170E|nr:YpmA family protein [Salipaludibacillus daqingensis]